MGQADQWSVICLQDTLHWSHDSLQFMAPQCTVHTNVLQLDSVPRRLTAQHADFGMVTVIQGGISTRLAERTNRILVSELKLDKGKIAIVNLYAPVQLAKATRVHVASMRLPRRRESEDQTQFEARQQKRATDCCRHRCFYCALACYCATSSYGTHSDSSGWSFQQ